MTTVVNVKNKDCDVYIGRSMPTTKVKATQGLDGYFGNPYRVEDYSGERERCIQDYKEHFFVRLISDPEFYERVQKLKGKTLGCWCWPDACHGEVIVEYLDNQ